MYIYLHFFQLRCIFTIIVKNYLRIVHIVLNRNFIYKLYQYVKNILKNYYNCNNRSKLLTLEGLHFAIM